MNRLFRRVVYFLRQRRLDAELAEEMEFHRRERQARLEDSGVPAAEAERTSRRRLGNVTLAREDARGVWIAPSLDSVWQDVRQALVGLRRDPAFTLVASLALATAIGLNVGLFTAYDAFMWQPWPVADAARFVTMLDDRGRANFTLAEYDQFASHSRTLSGLVATRCLDGMSEGCSLDVDGQAISVDFVTAGYFDVLGIAMERGAGFGSGTASGDPIAVVSDRAWRLRFGGAEDVIGRRIRLDGVLFTIVGVAAPGFSGTTLDRKDLWIPMAAMPHL